MEEKRSGPSADFAGAGPGDFTAAGSGVFAGGAPGDFAEAYVLAHELVHLHEPNHGPEFQRRLLCLLPDAPQRRQWLAEHGSDYQ